MQNAKDTFYEVLRSRIAAANPERTIVLRGVIRPGVLVEENELVTTVTMPDCFRLRWLDATVDAANALPVATLTCEVMYETAGTAGNAGLDRGRLLTEMDAELTAAVNACPQHSLKQNYAALANGGSATPLTTNIWWSNVALGPLIVKGDRIGRTAKITVMSCEEAGEL
ncbi:MAG TPA: hypothetical protein VGU25_12085 [Acidobacteriaceae bacterium]|nr:hypothetical protein [Acidobacteriaceae bacterium]